MIYAERLSLEEERTLSVEMIQKLYEVTALDMQPAPLRVGSASRLPGKGITATRVKTRRPNLKSTRTMEGSWTR